MLAINIMLVPIFSGPNFKFVIYVPLLYTTAAFFFFFPKPPSIKGVNSRSQIWSAVQTTWGSAQILNSYNPTTYLLWIPSDRGLRFPMDHLLHKWAVLGPTVGQSLRWSRNTTRLTGSIWQMTLRYLQTLPPKFGFWERPRILYYLS